jgi:hypothetical protein
MRFLHFLRLVLALRLGLLEPIAVCSEDEIGVFMQGLSDLAAHDLPKRLSIGYITELLVIKEAAIGSLNRI